MVAGLHFSGPGHEERLLGRISCPEKGIMLDTGHLMNTDLSLTSEAQGVEYIHRMLDRHGEMIKWIRGIHLHQSLSGAYVRENTGALPAGLSRDYPTRFGESYAHILRIDRHRPWTEPRSGASLRASARLSDHELSAGSRASARARTQQTQTLPGGPVPLRTAKNRSRIDRSVQLSVQIRINAMDCCHGRQA